MNENKGVKYEKANKEVVEMIRLTADIDRIDGVIRGGEGAELRLDIEQSGIIELSPLEDEKVKVLINKLGMILMKGFFKGLNTQNPNINVKITNGKIVQVDAKH